MTANTPRSVDKVDVFGNIAIATFTLVLFAAAYVVARSWPAAAAIFPEGITLAGTTLSALLLAILVFRVVRGRHAGDEAPAVELAPAASLPHGEGELMSEAEEEDYDLEYAFAHASKKQWGAVLGWLLAYFGGLWVFGAMLTTLVVTVLYLKIEARQRTHVAVLYAVALFLIMWASQKYMHVALPQGLLFSEG